MRLSGGSTSQTDFRCRTTGSALHSPVEIASVCRMLNHTLPELNNHAVATMADLYALAWRQAGGCAAQ